MNSYVLLYGIYTHYTLSATFSQQDYVRYQLRGNSLWLPLQLATPFSGLRAHTAAWILRNFTGMWRDFEITPFTSRAAAAAALRSRCTSNPAAQKQAWQNAWGRYRFDAQFILPPLRFISVYDIAAKAKQHKADIEYKTLAVVHFLPVLQSRLPLLSGKAKVRVADTVATLQHWRLQLNLPIPKKHTFSAIPTPKKSCGVPFTNLPLPPRFANMQISTRPKPTSSTLHTKKHVASSKDGGEGVFTDPIDHSDSPDAPEIWFEFEPLPNISNYDIYNRK